MLEPSPISICRKRERSPKPAKRAYFVRKPRYQLTWTTITVRHWLFWKREKKVRAVRYLGELCWWSPLLGRFVTLPVGTISDGASVPQFLWDRYPPFGVDGNDYVHAAGAHDHWCRLGKEEISPLSHVEAAKEFRQLMLAEHVDPTIARRMFFAVRWLGPKFRARRKTRPEPVI